jgi:hypothetical protein
MLLKEACTSSSWFTRLFSSPNTRKTGRINIKNKKINGNKLRYLLVKMK